MTKADLADAPLGLAMDLGHRIAQASSTGIPTHELCYVVVDVAIAACRASGMGRQEILSLFTERTERPVQEVPST